MGIKKQCKIFKVNLNLKDEAKDTENLNRFLQTNDVILVSPQFVSARVDHYMVFVVYLTKEAALEKKVSGIKETCVLPDTVQQTSLETDMDLVAKLKEWRGNEAAKRKWSPYMVLKNTVIEEIAAIKPTSIATLRHIKGMGVKKEEAFGNELL